MTPLKYDNFMTPYKGNTAFNLNPKLQEYKKLYFDKYAKEILVSCVYNNHYDRYTFFFKVPSGENDKYPAAIMYDVIIEFAPSDNIKKHSKTLAELDDYDIYIFSNSPGFVFTFDYVVKHKYGFPHCIDSSYLSKIAITKAPIVRNTFEIMTVEKTSWLCFFHLVHNGYLTKELCKKILSKNNEKYFIKSVESQPRKLKEIKDLQNIMREEKLKEKQRQANKLNKDYINSDLDEKHSMFNFNFKTPFSMKNNKIVEKIGKFNNIEKFKTKMKTSFKMK